LSCSRIVANVSSVCVESLNFPGIPLGGKRGFVKAELYTTEAVFDTLKDEWDGLLSPERTTDFFMTLIWQRIWWKHLGRGSLSVVAVRNDVGVLLGLGPWFIEEQGGQRSVRTIGCKDVTDYLGVMTQDGQEKVVFQTLLDFMCSAEAPQWDVFNLCNIPQDHPTLTLLPSIVEAAGLTPAVEDEDVCPVIYLPDTYETYLESLDKKQRHELRRKRRRAEEYGVEFYTVGPEHNLDQEIDAFFELMAMSTPDKAAFLQEAGHMAFFHEMGHAMLDAGFLHLIFLMIEGQRAAAMWQFKYHDRMMLYNSGLNPAAYSALSSGIVLLTFSIQDAIERGCKVYDFLQGNEEYKYRMGAVTTTVHNLTIQRH
jgi:CelD/BcsL family acetyltransferase involved in cellulose biosynthesis